MPADITGTEILEETGEGRRRMQFVKGPIFANVILADEINRTPPKTQAALLEAMQEHQVTAAGVRYPLEEPFFVLATQNPIEMEGTYPLPEAQLDRFMFNVIVDYLPEDDEVAVVQPDDLAADRRPIEPLFDGQDVLAVPRGRPQGADRRGPRPLRRAAGRGQPARPGGARLRQRLGELGRGPPRRAVAVLGAKARALLAGRFHVTPEDIRALVHPTLRHRILLGYRAEADGVTVDTVIDRLLEHLKGPFTDVLPRSAPSRSGPASAAEATAAARPASLIDPQTLMRIKSLQMRARVAVQGFIKGIHRSPYHGFSVEFSEYREYSPGDDPRFLDWRLYAAVGPLLREAVRGRDQPALPPRPGHEPVDGLPVGGVHQDRLRPHRGRHDRLFPVAPARRGRPLHLRGSDHGLPAPAAPARPDPPPDGDARARAEGARDRPGRAARADRRDRPQRGLIILISDLLAPIDTLRTRLGYLRSRGHEVIVLRILDPAEVEFRFETPGMFLDLESGRELYIDPGVAREDYLRRFTAHRRRSSGRASTWGSSTS